MAAKRTKKATKKTTVSPKTTRDLYTGMSGQFAAMSEFLWRGYNVAVPAVDTGEDIFVVEAASGVLRRVQVKTAGKGVREKDTKTVQFKLSRHQLDLALSGSELFFMLLARWDDVDARRPWRWILIPRDKLNDLRLNPPPGRRGPKPDQTASDVLQMSVQLSAADATAWGHSLFEYLDKWSADWPVAGPKKAPASAPAVMLAGRL